MSYISIDEHIETADESGVPYYIAYFSDAPPEGPNGEPTGAVTGYGENPVDAVEELLVADIAANVRARMVR